MDDVTPIDEFDCTQCGRHIISLCGPPDQTLCAACIALPGWFNDPVLAHLIDPEYEATLPAAK